MLAVEAMEQAAQRLVGGNFVALQSQNGTAIMQIRPQGLRDAIIALRDGEDTRLNHLSYMTAFDRHPLTPRFEVVYELYSVQYRHRIRLKCQLEDTGDEKRLPQIDSIADLYLTANWHEREAYDLFGISFRNHPDPRRILLPDMWDGYPLRKEYPFDGKPSWELGTTVKERKGTAEISLGLEPDTDDEESGDRH